MWRFPVWLVLSVHAESEEWVLFWNLAALNWKLKRSFCSVFYWRQDLKATSKNVNFAIQTEHFHFYSYLIQQRSWRPKQACSQPHAAKKCRLAGLDDITTLLGHHLFVRVFLLLTEGPQTPQVMRNPFASPFGSSSESEALLRCAALKHFAEHCLLVNRKFCHGWEYTFKQQTLQCGPLR